jgi:pimeloyl-ACP methyl ester carboxylesterase
VSEGPAGRDSDARADLPGKGRRDAPGWQPLVAERRGQGPSVVLLHGQPGTAWDWQWVAPLIEDDFHVLIPDRPGYGRTGGPATGFAGNASAAVDLLDRDGIERAILVGHSWAGGVVIAAAERFPDRVAGAVLVASVGPGARIGWEDRLLSAPVLGEAIAAVTIGGAGLILGSRRVQRLADERLAGRAREAVTALTELTHGYGASRVWKSFVAEQRALISELEGLGPGLRNMATPTVIINGAGDRIVPPAVAAMLAATIPRAVHIELPGVGHLLPRDRPGQIADAVRSVDGRGPGSA